MLTDYKQVAIRIAKDLEYTKEVIEKIKDATNDNEISRIMTTQRQSDMY